MPRDALAPLASTNQGRYVPVHKRRSIGGDDNWRRASLGGEPENWRRSSLPAQECKPQPPRKAAGTVRYAKGPDGTRGFAAGRGRPMPRASPARELGRPELDQPLPLQQPAVSSPAFDDSPLPVPRNSRRESIFDLLESPIDSRFIETPRQAAASLVPEGLTAAAKFPSFALPLPAPAAPKAEAAKPPGPWLPPGLRLEARATAEETTAAQDKAEAQRAAAAEQAAEEKAAAKAAKAKATAERTAALEAARVAAEEAERAALEQAAQEKAVAEQAAMLRAAEEAAAEEAAEAAAKAKAAAKAAKAKAQAAAG